jgi:hypothetical protein
MNTAKSLTGRSIHSLAAGLSALAIAVGIAAVSLTGTFPARAGTPSPAAVAVIRPARMEINELNWSSRACCGSRSPAWYKDGSGIVHLQGAVSQTNSSGPGANLIGSLPLAARPHHNIFTIVHTASGTYTDLVILTNGKIGLIDPRPPAVKDYSFVSLEGITFLQ